MKVISPNAKLPLATYNSDQISFLERVEVMKGFMSQIPAIPTSFEPTPLSIIFAVNYKKYDVVPQLLQADKSLLNVFDPVFGSLLHRAVSIFDHQMCELLIKAGVDINLRDGQGYTALDRLLERSPYNQESKVKKIELVKFFLDSNANVNNNKAKDDVENVIVGLIKREEYEIFKLLLQYGRDLSKDKSDIVAFAKKDRLPINFVIGLDYLIEAFVNKLNAPRSDNEAKVALNGSIDGLLNYISTLFRNELRLPDSPFGNELSKAILLGDISTVLKYLRDGRADPNWTDGSGVSLLHLAAGRLDEAMCSVLIESGATIDIGAEYGRSTPLSSAISRCDRINEMDALAVINLLVAKGADVNGCDGKSEGFYLHNFIVRLVEKRCLDVLTSVILAGRDLKNDKPALLKYAEFIGISGENCKLLDSKIESYIDELNGLKSSKDSSGDDRKVHNVASKISQELLDYFTNPALLSDESLHKAFCRAVANGHPDIAEKYLLTSRINIEKPDWRGESFGTLLHLAARDLNLDMSKVLIRYGASVNSCGYGRVMPLAYAINICTKRSEKKALDVISFLIERGADGNSFDGDSEKTFMKNPIVHLVENQCLEILNVIIKAGRDLQKDKSALLKHAKFIGISDENCKLLDRKIEDFINELKSLKYNNGLNSKDKKLSEVISKFSQDLLEYFTNPALLSDVNLHEAFRNAVNNGLCDIAEKYLLTGRIEVKKLNCNDLVACREDKSMIELLESYVLGKKAHGKKISSENKYSIDGNSRSTKEVNRLDKRSRSEENIAGSLNYEVMDTGLDAKNSYKRSRSEYDINRHLTYASLPAYKVDNPTMLAPFKRVVNSLKQ